MLSLLSTHLWVPQKWFVSEKESYHGTLAPPKTRYVDQTGLELTEIYLCMPPECWDKSACHHVQPFLHWLLPHSLDARLTALPGLLLLSLPRALLPACLSHRLPGSGNPDLVLTLALDAHWEMRMFPAPLWLALFFKGKLGEMRIGDKRFHQVASFPSPLSRAPAHTTIIISSDFCSFLGSDYNFYRPARGLY